MTGGNAPRIEFDGESFSVDAELIAGSFGVTPASLKTLMQQSSITSRCERGVDADAGRHRLTFFFGARRLSLVVDEAGAIVERQVDRVS